MSRLGCPWVVRSEMTLDGDVETLERSLFIRPQSGAPRYWVAYAAERARTLYFYAIEAPRERLQRPLGIADTFGGGLARESRSLSIEEPETYQLRPSDPGRSVLLVASDEPINSLERLGSRVFPDRPKGVCSTRSADQGEIRQFDREVRRGLACLADPSIPDRSLCGLILSVR